MLQFGSMPSIPNLNSISKSRKSKELNNHVKKRLKAVEVGATCYVDLRSIADKMLDVYPKGFFHFKDNDYQQLMEYLTDHKELFFNKIVSFKSNSMKKKYYNVLQNPKNHSTISLASNNAKLTKKKVVYWCEFPNTAKMYDFHCNVVVYNPNYLSHWLLENASVKKVLKAVLDLKFHQLRLVLF